MRILLIEDDKKAAHLLERGFREEGFAVDIVHTARAGDEHAFVSDYAAIVLDWMLPDGDGLGLCRELRRRGSQVPILMLTAKDALIDRISGLDAGADDYLTKPFAFGELLARLRALLRRSEMVRPAVLTVRDLSLDPATQRATRGGNMLDLTRKEFVILLTLMRHAGAVVSRTQLAEQVWQTDVETIDSIIDVHISNLRRKLDADGAAPLIQTLRGRGYRLVAEG
jgi:DNA-binding response OmpR family regulator